MIDRLDAWRSASATAHSIPSIMPEKAPQPAHESTCTETMLAPGATPYAAPPAVDAQCVPWPSQ